METLVCLARNFGVPVGLSIGGVEVECRPGDVVEEVEESQITVTAGVNRGLEPA